ncbi:hypothetical protein HOE04_01420 [archaeon]|jgi:hypothetical protein|nr:hypothetical protein [archaeon]
MDKKFRNGFRYGMVCGAVIVMGSQLALHSYFSAERETEMPLPKVELPAESVPVSETPLHEKILEFEGGEIRQYREFKNLYENPLPVWDKGPVWA